VPHPDNDDYYTLFAKEKQAFFQNRKPRTAPAGHARFFLRYLS